MKVFVTVTRVVYRLLIPNNIAVWTLHFQCKAYNIRFRILPALLILSFCYTFIPLIVLLHFVFVGSCRCSKQHSQKLVVAFYGFSQDTDIHRSSYDICSHTQDRDTECRPLSNSTDVVKQNTRKVNFVHIVVNEGDGFNENTDTFTVPAKVRECSLIIGRGE